MQRWKMVFRRDFKEKLRQIQAEYDRYKATDRLINLQQAGEKLFSAVENYLMLKYEERKYSYGALIGMKRMGGKDRVWLANAAALHEFFYNADADETRDR